MKKIAINGFGRIGRLAFRKLWKEKSVEVVAINDLTDAKTLAYLLEHDTAQGLFLKGKISYKEGKLIVDGKEIIVCSEREPNNLPWKQLGVDIVIESTGFFRTKEKAQLHIDAGAKKVVISAPASGEMPTIVFGVNHKELTKEDTIISGASCTTNCLVPLVYVLNKEFGLKRGLMTTIHAATNDQRILDLPHSDLRRGRSVFNNIIPTDTGAAIAVGKVMPEMNGKLDGYSLRIPAVTGSIVDLTCELEKNVTAEEINQAMEKYAKGYLSKTMEYNDQPIVSTDVYGSSFGSIFDATLTKVIETDGKQMVKVFSFYDNEMSYVSQMIRTTIYFAAL